MTIDDKVLTELFSEVFALAERGLSVTNAQTGETWFVRPLDRGAETPCDAPEQPRVVNW